MVRDRSSSTQRRLSIAAPSSHRSRFRAEHKLGRRIHLGGFVAAGMPAYYGQHELAVSADVEQVLRDHACEPSADVGWKPELLRVASLTSYMDFSAYS